MTRRTLRGEVSGVSLGCGIARQTTLPGPVSNGSAQRRGAVTRRKHDAPGGTGRPRSKTSTTITVTHEHVPRWVEAAKRAGMTPPQYVARVMERGTDGIRDAAYLHGYRSALREMRATLEQRDAEAEVMQTAEADLSKP